MKLFISILSLAFGLLFSGGELTDEISQALRQGKYADIAKYFDQKVSLKLINQEDVLSKSQAEANLKYFFEKHPVKGFTGTHASTVNNSQQYITGTLETTNEKFHVSILIRRGLISQFRIETDND